MDEARLTEIEHGLTEDGSHILCDGQDEVTELIAEVRRLKKAVDGSYEDGSSNREADIVGIILDPIAGDNATAEEILHELKDHLGLEEEDLPIAIRR